MQDIKFVVYETKSIGQNWQTYLLNHLEGLSWELE